MFKSARWRTEKNKFKAEFKLQFHATQISELGVDALAIFVVPGDVGKPTLRLEKATVRGGNCRWENPAYVTVKFDKEQKTGKINEKIYHFRVSTGLARAIFLGEASIDFAKFAEATKPSSVSLPLQNSNSGAILHIWIQRIQDDADQREMEQYESVKSRSQEESLKSYLNNGDGNKNHHTEDGFSNETGKVAELNGNHRASCESDVTLSSSESSSGLDSPIENGIRNTIHQVPNGFRSPLRHTMVPQKSPAHEKNQTVQWKWSLQSNNVVTSNDSIVDSLSLGKNNMYSDADIELLKTELSVMARRADISNMELESLRRQIAKESKKSQDLLSDVFSLKEERDELKVECDKLRDSQKRMDDTKIKNMLSFEGGDLRALLEEMRQELNYEKELNSNLRLQLQKTQESNTELIFAVRDLEEMLDQKNCEISNLHSESKSKEKIEEMKCQIKEDDDEEQKALYRLVNDEKDYNKASLLEHKVIDLYNEMEIHMRDKDELEMKVEQLALDYEILKQENHELLNKLEQSRLQEQLKIQYECSSSAITINELETKIESVENELKLQSTEYSDTIAAVRVLESQVKNLEEELDRQGQEFEADLEAMTLRKVEQEQRAIRAEEALRKMRLKNANTAEKLQEDFGKLSEQITSTFEANERLAMKALMEAGELRSQRSHLEEALQKANEDMRTVREDYEKKLEELSYQIKRNSSQVDQMLSELKTKSKQLEFQKKSEDMKFESFSREIKMLKSEVDRLIRENDNLKKQAGHKETMKVELEQVKTLLRETEMLIQTRNVERNDLVTTVVLMKKESDKLLNEIKRLRNMKDEKEILLGLLQSEFQKLKVECNDLKHSLAEDETEKEKLIKQVLQLKDDLKKEEAFNNSEKKLKYSNGRIPAAAGNKVTSKTKLNSVSPNSTEVANLREKIKMLEKHIKLKENTLAASENSFLQKEQNFCNRILELENRLEGLNHFHLSQKVITGQNEAVLHNGISEETRDTAGMNYISIRSDGNSIEPEPKVSTSSDGDENLEKLIIEMSNLKEKNKSMESELKDMEERYSEISLRFAEVEGERQQLVMTVRNLRNAKKS